LAVVAVNVHTEVEVVLVMVALRVRLPDILPAPIVPVPEKPVKSRSAHLKVELNVTTSVPAETLRLLIAAVLVMIVLVPVAPE